MCSSDLAGSQPLQISSANQLRDLLPAVASSDWLPTVGPSATIALGVDANNQPRLQLLGVSSGGWTLKGSGLAAVSEASLKLEVGMPLLSFDPTAKGTVDAVNNTLHLPGLAASNGQVFTYYADPNFSSTVSQPALASGFSNGVLAGSNRWNGVQLPSELADGRLVSATFLTGIPLPISPTAPADLTPTETTPPPRSFAGLNDGTPLYLKQVKDDAGTAVLLYSDAEGQRPLLLSAAAASSSPAYFQVQVSQSQGSVPIHGLTPGEQFQLHALGNDLYQVAVDPLQYNQSQPFALRGQQITANTQLRKATEASSSSQTTKAPGITLTTKVDAKDKAKSSGGTGSNPKLRDVASNPWIGVKMAATESSFLGTKFKDSIQKSGGNENPNFSKSTNKGSISGSVAVNIANHVAKVTLGASSLLTSSGKVTIGKIGRAHV